MIIGMGGAGGMDLVCNRQADRGALYGADAAAVVSLAEVARARALISACPWHAQTPLRRLDSLAADLGVGAIIVKDETRRLGLTSFKALGGAYAVLRQAALPHPAGRGPRVFVTATDGNHGISVAAGAKVAGGRSVIFLAGHVGAAYEQTMRSLGAEIVRTGESYDKAVDAAAQAAAVNGWTLVADTTPLELDPITRDVMAGYGVLLEECIDQLDAAGWKVSRGDVSHLFVQGGVGGLAAALAGGLWERFGDKRPTVVIVEPESADCLYQSALAGRMASASGDLATSMGMLSCGRASRMAWTILKTAADHFMVIDDAWAARGQRALAEAWTWRGFATTPSGGAGVAGLMKAASDPALRRAVGLEGNSVVLTVCTEGPPDPEGAAAAFLAREPARAAGD